MPKLYENEIALDLRANPIIAKRLYTLATSATAIYRSAQSEVAAIIAARSDEAAEVRALKGSHRARAIEETTYNVGLSVAKPRPAELPERYANLAALEAMQAAWADAPPLTATALFVSNYNADWHFIDELDGVWIEHIGVVPFLEELALDRTLHNICPATVVLGDDGGILRFGASRKVTTVARRRSEVPVGGPTGHPQI